MVIGFLNPIIHSNKPKKVVSLWASTFINSLKKKDEVDCVDPVQQLVKNAWNAKSKASIHFSIFLAHLYAKHELLKSEDQQTYEKLLEIQKYGGLKFESGKESDLSDLPELSLVEDQSNKVRQAPMEWRSGGTCRTNYKRKKRPNLPNHPVLITKNLGKRRCGVLQTCRGTKEGDPLVVHWIAKLTILPLENENVETRLFKF